MFEEMETLLSDSKVLTLQGLNPRNQKADMTKYQATGLQGSYPL
jgi:hypothetical protein